MDKETFETWNNVAAIYQDKFMDMDLYNDTYDYICKYLTKPNAKVLDIGCGPGNISKYLLSQKADLDILGIDIAPNMISLARINNPSARFEIMDTRAIDTINDTFDAIICGFCLPYLSSIESQKFITDAYTLLHQKGLIYISFVEGDPKNSAFKAGQYGRVYFNYHLLKDITDCLSSKQFENIKIFNVNYKTTENTFDIHTILVANKK